MYKTLLLLLGLSGYGQKLHHQAISSQGANVRLVDKIVVSQSIGQSSAVGNVKNNNIIVGQGYIQSIGKTERYYPAQNTISVFAYPNPIVDIATFKFSYILESSGTITLFDSRGRFVYSQKIQFSQNLISINLSALAAGIYFVKFETSNNTFSTKILKS